MASAAGLTQLWIRVLSEPASRALAGTEDAANPFWSADGEPIAFLQYDAPRKLFPMPPSPKRTAGAYTVSPDGKRLWRATIPRSTRNPNLT